MVRCEGFSLAELAVTMLIVSLLLAGALIPFGTQIDLKNVTDTQRTMESIREALIGFAQANGRLPCPAAGNLAAGTEQFTAPSCTALMGVVPWVTLGVPETDAWGRRFSYRVSPAFADSVENPPGTPLATWNTRAAPYVPPAPPPTFLPQSVSSPASPANQPSCNLVTPPTLSSFALCSLGDIAVFTRGTIDPVTLLPTSTAVPLGTALPAVIISHGKNGLGAWQPNGTQVNPIPVGNDEARNVSGSTTATPLPSPPGYLSVAFYSRTPAPSAAGCADPLPGTTNAAQVCEFDDIVIAITSNVLIARMVSAGRLP
jgi:prepilin-type N-terminal cleavage/methylation domain-containing protein